MDLPTSAAVAPSPRTEGSGPLYRKTGPEHFSALADKTTAKDQIPPCMTCGLPSIGGVIMDQAPMAAQGCPVYELEFYCLGDLDGRQAQVMSHALYPHYHHVSGMGSRRIYRRLSREEALQRVGAGR